MCEERGLIYACPLYFSTKHILIIESCDVAINHGWATRPQKRIWVKPRPLFTSSTRFGAWSTLLVKVGFKHVDEVAPE